MTKGGEGEVDRSVLHRQRLASPTNVYRFVRLREPSREQLEQEFFSDKIRGKRAIGRASRIPELQDGISVFRTLELARIRWADIAVRARRRAPAADLLIGEFVARVQLKPDDDVYLEDLGQADGHLTLWGSSELLASRVTGITNAEARIDS
jgi:hypothetical protein